MKALWLAIATLASKQDPIPRWEATAMLESYEAIYENGQLTWLADQPRVTSARIME